MAGAFAHITAVNCANNTTQLKQLTSMPKKAKLILVSNPEYVELGCISPDYPYLSLGKGSSKQKLWADIMHYEKMGDLIRQLIVQVKSLLGDEQDKAFAWLCGFVAHVITDITIHPVIELKVGRYQGHEAEHRTCEMHQDTYIWQRLNLGDIGYADRIRDNIGSCSSPQNKDLLDPTIEQLWRHSLEIVYPEHFISLRPNVNQWHRGFQTIVDNVEEGYRLFPIARHVAAGHGYLYPSVDDIDTQFIDNLKTPNDLQNYDAIFDKAVLNILKYWCIVSNAVFTDGGVDDFLNWNLDTGLCENGNLTAWME